MSVTRWDEDANPEEAWFGHATVEQLAALRAQVLELGESPATAHGLVGWIVGAELDAASNKTRATYRRILREVGPPGRPRRRRGARAGVGQRGAARIELLTASVGASALVLVAAPIILGESTPEPETATQGVIRLADRREARGFELPGSAMATAVGF